MYSIAHSVQGVAFAARAGRLVQESRRRRHSCDKNSMPRVLQGSVWYGRDGRACIQESRKARLRGAVTFSDSWNCCTKSSMLKCSCAVTMSCGSADSSMPGSLATTRHAACHQMPWGKTADITGTSLVPLAHMQRLTRNIGMPCLQAKPAG